MEQVLNKDFIDFYGAIRDGVELCVFLNKIEPNICKPRVPANDTEIEYFNRNQFIAGCGKLCVDNRFLMAVTDLDNEENILSVIINLYALCVVCEEKKEWNGTTINRLEKYKYTKNRTKGSDTGWSFHTYIGRVDGSGKMKGYGMTIYNDDAWYKGGNANNKQNGWGIMHWADGEHYDGSYKDGKCHGYGKRIYPDGNIYNGEWNGGQYHGFGTFIWKDGTSYQGSWKDSNQNGFGVMIFKDGSKYEGSWKNAKFHGQGTKTEPNGEIKEGLWENYKYIKNV